MPRGNHILIAGQLIGKDVGDEVQSVQQAPAYKRHIGAMPQTAEAEDEQHHGYVLHLAAPVAAHGQVQVVQHPFAQTCVPPPPELARVAAEERHLEVLRQFYAHQPAHAPCYLRIGREVGIEVEVEEHDAQKHRTARQVIVAGIAVVHHLLYIGSYHHLFEKPPQYFGQRPLYNRITRERWPPELRQYGGRGGYRPRQQMREEADVGRVGHKILLGR